MSPFDAIESTAQRIERASARYAVALRSLAEFVAPFQNEYLFRVSHDGPTCITLLLVDARGLETGICLEANFDLGEPMIWLLIDEGNGDFTVQEVEGHNPFGKAFEQLLLLLKT